MSTTSISTSSQQLSASTTSNTRRQEPGRLLALVSVVVAAALFMGGCATTSTVMLGNSRPAINPENVRLYLTAPEEYEEIALLTADSDGSWTFSQQAKMEEVIRRLKIEAASVGANGILIRGIGDRSEDPIIITDEDDDWSTGFGFSELEKTAWAVAIWVPDDEENPESLFSMLGRSGLFSSNTVASVE